MTLELAVASENLADGIELMQDSWKSNLSPEEIASTEMVVDFDAEQTTCPACMTIFRPETPMCPGCGLRFG